MLHHTFEILIPEEAYKENKTGPRHKPWGTPETMGRAEEIELPISTTKVLLCKYDENHFNTIPLMLTQTFKENPMIHCIES